MSLFFFLQDDIYGIPKFLESNKIHVAGLVVSEYCETWSHWEGSCSLGDWLKKEGITGIFGVYVCDSVYTVMCFDWIL